MPIPPPKEPLPQTVPSDLLAFPRTWWDGVVFGHPVFDPVELGRKCQWAAREASRRWSRAMETRDLGDLDDVDFALAVLDMTDMTNMHARYLRARHGRYGTTTERWVFGMGKIISALAGISFDTVAKAFPTDPHLSQRFNVDVASEFATAAIKRLWEYGSDSFGPRPEKTDIDERFLRYLPASVSVPPRQFTLADPYGLHPDAPLHVWLDSHLREVAPPQDEKGAVSAKADLVTSASSQSLSLGSEYATSSGSSDSDESDASPPATALVHPGEHGLPPPGRRRREP